MPKYRHALPQLNGDLFLTDGGIETTLVFHDGLELPEFAAFDLLRSAHGTEALRRYFRRYASIARNNGVGFILESATWRASPDWAEKIGYSDKELADANRRAVELLHEIRDECANDATPIVISGCVGPRGDGYNPEFQMSEREAERYHRAQVAVFDEAGADMITAITMTYAEEAIGVTRAARTAGLPVAISFTTETDGRLPSGQTLKDAIEQVDNATGDGPAYFMLNCAHTTHFEDALHTGAVWTRRIRGVRANASTLSHAELDEAEELDDGDPEEFGHQHAELSNLHPHFTIFGGCCGTDHRHVEAICKNRLMAA